MDVGTESYTEKEKGQASDSFKRACVSVGIGRELYTAPFIWIAASKVSIQPKGDRYITYDKFKVKEISYNDNREIIGLTISNQDGKVVYSLNASNGQNTKYEVDNTLPMVSQSTSPAAERVKQMNKELERTGVALDTVLSRYQVNSVEEMSEPMFTNALNSLKKTRKKVA